MKKGKIKKVFRSRISVFFIGFLLVAFTPAFIPIFQRGIQGMNFLFVTFSFIVFFFCGIRYVISEDKLYLKIWFIPVGSANISDIISIERTYNPISSPAASLKRLCIRFKRGVSYSNWATWQSAPIWLLSPVKEKEFVEALKTINPAIYVKIVDKQGKWRFWDWDI